MYYKLATKINTMQTYNIDDMIIRSHYQRTPKPTQYSISTPQPERYTTLKAIAISIVCWSLLLAVYIIATK